MKRKLVVMRHAHAEPTFASPADQQRQLTAKGRGDALRMAAHIQSAGWTPQRVLCSAATRAKQTWENMAQVFDGPVDLHTSDSLYLADVDQACDALFAVADDVDRVALIAHNPGLQNLVGWLAGRPPRLSPAAAVLLSGAGDTWAEATRQQGWQIDDILRPDIP